jgi:ribosomal protein S18 acetylase RimI-like enzyme
MSGNQGEIATPTLRMAYALVPWDTAACGFPVGDIRGLELLDAERAGQDFAAFEHWRAAHGARLVACRLPHQALAESMFLEARGFRFVEMVLSPQAEIARLPVSLQEGFEIAPAGPSDLPGIEAMALTAFTTDRFTIEPRIPRVCGGERYRRWVASALAHPRQALFKVTAEGRLLAFFITEDRTEGGLVHWHLHAVAPGLQGQGWGKRIWRAMIERERARGLARIATTVSARNAAVLNLYAGLGFRFGAPQMTFHWVGGADE